MNLVRLALKPLEDWGAGAIAHRDRRIAELERENRELRGFKLEVKRMVFEASVAPGEIFNNDDPAGAMRLADAFSQEALTPFDLSQLVVPVTPGDRVPDGAVINAHLEHSFEVK